jgi:hypothetical protein
MLPLLAIGAFIGGALTGIGKLKEASANARAMRFNAKNAEEDATLADRNATLILARATDDERKYRVMARRQLGTIQAAQGASGLIGGEEILQEAASVFENDALNIRIQGNLSASATRLEAKRKREYAQQLRSGAGDLITGAALSVAGSAVANLADVGDKLLVRK